MLFLICSCVPSAVGGIDLEGSLMPIQSFQFASVDSFRDGGSSSVQAEAEKNSEVLVEESVQKRIKGAVCVG